MKKPKKNQTKLLHINPKMIYNVKEIYVERMIVMTNKSGRRHSKIMIIVVAAVALFAGSMYGVLKADINKKQIELDALNAQYEEISANNEEINSLINETDEAKLYEHLARERGYVYPDEKIYYDVTPGN